MGRPVQYPFYCQLYGIGPEVEGPPPVSLVSAHTAKSSASAHAHIRHMVVFGITLLL